MNLLVSLWSDRMVEKQLILPLPFFFLFIYIFHAEKTSFRIEYVFFSVYSFNQWSLTGSIDLAPLKINMICARWCTTCLLFVKLKAAVPWLWCTHSFIRHHPVVHCLSNTADSFSGQPVFPWLRPHDATLRVGVTPHTVLRTIKRFITVLNWSVLIHITNKWLQILFTAVFQMAKTKQVETAH